MSGTVKRRRPLTAEALARLCEAVAPGSSPIRVRRLGGGLDAVMHAVDLVLPSGERQRLVVRRYLETILERSPWVAARAWRTLSALQALDIAAPRPVLLDEGEMTGEPGLVMTRLAGRPQLCARDLGAWTGQLATALATIHRAPIAGIDLSFLPPAGEHLEEQFARLAAAESRIDQHPDAPAVTAALERWRPRLRRATPVLLHGDYWAGNTLWQRGRLTGVVDWDWAAIGHPGIDVGYCRLDLAMLMGPEAPDLFLQTYEAAAGRRIPQLFFWDLLEAVSAMPDPAKWLPGYHDLGRTEITPGLMRDRLRAFIADALRRAE